MIKRIVANCFLKLKVIIDRAIHFHAIEKINSADNINLGSNVIINGTPIIDIRCGCNLLIGHDVTLNSNNIGYHINMHSPVKLFADKIGSEIIIGARTRIHGSCIHAYKSIKIGENCLIAANCHIIDGNGHDLSFPDVDNRINTQGECRAVIIEDNVWLGANCIVLPGVTIGNGSVISANSVVTKNIPAMVVAGGNPAKEIKRL